MNEIDLYSTHLEFINSIFEFKGKLNNIVEFGCGDYSTKLLIDNGNNILTIEMQSEDWYEKIKEKFKNFKNWKFLKLIGPYNFFNATYPESIDFSFVDGHGDSRPDCINLMMKYKCPIIMTHDTEEPGYKWFRVENKDNYKKMTFTKYRNWTTIWTLDSSLYDFLYKKYIDVCLI